ncbi:MAG: Flp pilus assembly protein CpaB [Gemmataceae bacterium]|nr:Flp pilus assembly protein CpaB [Gemmataceae bacterium]
MNPRVLVGGMALICGLGAFYMVNKYIKNREKAEVEVLWTIGNVPLAEKIIEPEKYFIVRKVADGSFPPRALKKMEEIKDKQLAKSLSKENYVTVDDLLGEGQNYLTGSIKMGWRLVSLPVNDEALVGGHVLPGAMVDLVATRRIPNGKAESKRIIQNIRVMNVGEKTSLQLADKTTVTGNVVGLELSPEQEMVFREWKLGGEITLSVRSKGDTALLKEDPVKVEEKNPEKPAVKVEAPVQQPVVAAAKNNRHKLLILDTRAAQPGGGESAQGAVEFALDANGRWRTVLHQNEEGGFSGKSATVPPTQETPEPKENGKKKTPEGS